MVYYSFFGSNYWTIFFKYVFQAIKTLIILLKERPNIIFCMSPPVFTCIPVWGYCKIFPKTGYVVDYHTAAFTEPMFKKLFFMQKYFAQRAITNIVTNTKWETLVKNWGANVSIIGDVRVSYKHIDNFRNFKKGFNVTFVSRFSPTEPLDVVLEAARILDNEDVNIYITGSLKDAEKDVLNNHSKNIIFTDFLSDSEYAGLLRDSDAVMSLCTSDNTMQRGAYEAMSLETPLIISNWKLLQDTFYSGAVYIENTVEGIVNGVNEMRNNKIRYKEEIKNLKKERSKIWEKKRAEMLEKTSELI